MSSSAIPGLPARYQIISLIGRGGMARVWLAKDTLLDQEVAIKEIITAGGDPAKVRADVLREAQAAVKVSNLHHQGVIRILNVEDVKPNPLIIMEYVRGRSLEQTLAEDGPLSPERTRRVGLAVLAALRAAHGVQVLHRDVKPANILIATSGRIVLTDFGIAKFVNVPTTMQFQGTPAYVAPERLRHAPATVAADMWSLGVTLYECLTGVSPFRRDEVYATLMAVSTYQPPPAPPLALVLGGLLQKDPARRIGADQAEQMLRSPPLSPTRVFERGFDSGLPHGSDPGVPRSFSHGSDPGVPRSLPHGSDPGLSHGTGRGFPPGFDGGSDRGFDRGGGRAFRPPRRRRWALITALVLVLMLTAGGAYIWRNVRDPADLAVLQEFAGDLDLSTCKPATPTSLQKLKRVCDIGSGVRAYWILYQSSELRDARHDALPGCRGQTCESGNATGPGGGQGRYREFVGSDDNDAWAGLWWDDSATHPHGATALEIHGPYDRYAEEPAAAVRALWNGWGYQAAG